MRALGIRSYRRYGVYLDEHPDEYAELLDTLTINVTQFFRDVTVFDRFAATVVPRIIAAKREHHQRALRVWSAGCATGQEPYSIAMVLLAILGEHIGDFLVGVTGTDIDPRALEKAKSAVYPVKQLEQIPRRFRSGAVDVDGESFTVSSRVRDLVRFTRLNLFEDEPIHKVDVVFCRNVFIYFTREQQHLVSDRFFEALLPGGYLILGRSERLAPDLMRRLEPIDSKERIYRKRMT
jgi:chemotaxis protein methyltransferase CheR